MLDDRSKSNEKSVKSYSKNKSEPDLDYVDRAYNKITGNSWFYWFIAFPVGFVYWYGYSRLIPFLILMPKLSWTLNGGSDWVNCTEVEACASPQVLYQIDRQSEDSIINWITELDLVCTSKLNLSLLGSLYIIKYINH